MIFVYPVTLVHDPWKYGMFSFRRFLKRKNNHGKDVVRSATIANIYEDIENGNVGCHESQMS